MKVQPFPKGKRRLLRLQFFIVAATSIAVVLTIFIGNRVYQKNRKMAIEQFSRHQSILIRTAAVSIQSYLENLVAVLQAESICPFVQQAFSNPWEHIQHIYHEFHGTTSVRLLDEKGVLRSIYPLNGWRKTLLGRDYSGEAYFQTARNNNHVSVSELIINEQDDMRIRFVVPIYEINGRENVNNKVVDGDNFGALSNGEPNVGRFKGELIVSFGLNAIVQRFVAPIVSGETGYAWLLNEKGIFLAHHEKDFVGRNAFEVRREISSELSVASINQIQQQMLAGKTGAGRYVSGWHRDRIGKIRKLVAYAPIHIHDITWSVAVCAPINEVDRITRVIRKNEIFAFSIVVLFLVTAGALAFISTFRWSQFLEQEVDNRTRDLRKTRDYIDILIRYANGPIIVWDPEGKITIFNQAFEKISRWTEAEIIGQSLEILFPEESRSGSLKKIENVSKGNNWEGMEIPIIRKDGEIRIALWNSANIYSDDGKTLIATIAQGQDITERKQIEKEREKLVHELQDSLAEVETLSAISQTVNQSLNLDQILNDAMDRIIEQFKPLSAHIRILDNQTQELVLAVQRGLPPENLKQLPKRKQLEDAVSRHAIKSHKAVVIEDVLTDPRTAEIQIFTEKIGCRSLVTIPLVARNKILGTMTILGRRPNAFIVNEIEFFTSIGHQVGTAVENARLYQDKEITIKELKKMQEQLQQAQKMEAIGTLAGGIAHDFNNILGAIIGCTELSLLDVPEGNQTRGYLMEVLKAGNRAKNLVKQILAFSRQNEYEMKPVQPGFIVKEAVKLLRSSLPTTIQIRQNIRDDSGIVVADPTQIHQVLMNLGVNAGHAMREKGGMLTVSLSHADIDSNAAEQHPDLSPGPYVNLTVSDTGYGMDPLVMKRIFDPFFTTKGTGEGTGMGLSVVHGIVRSCGGVIRVDSDTGKGSTFQVLLPRSDTSQFPTKTEEIEALPTGNERILFVDDDKVLANTGKIMLERIGYEVAARTSSVEALEAFREQPDEFDLVITDQTMPNMTGTALANEIMGIRSGIPIILCTGYSESISEESAESMGIQAFIMKPFIMKKMSVIVRKVLDLQSNTMNSN